MEYNEAVQLNVRVDVQLDAETISSAVINGTADLVQAVEGLTEALTKGALFEKFQTGVEALSAGTSMIEISQSKSVLSAVSSVKEYIEAVKEAAPEVGILTAMFPKLSTALSNILPSITGVFSKIGSALSGLLPSITGVFSKIGSALSGLLPSITGVFSKIGTALSGLLPSITGVFSKIGTALSGISLGWGIVVAAIIAGIILLIQNWETVKAFLGTVAEWFNTAVIQPVVGFLTGLWTSITAFVSGLTALLMPYIQQFLLLVQTVLGNIQTFFTGLGEYLTGVFSVNWAEQFSAFGEVLNVFFAAVQEIWTAVQTIFEGVIQFVTGVFSGDWESAWNGIVQIFSGIWEGLEAAIKTPVNGVIGLINGLVKAVVSGINGAIDALNTLRFTVPDWVPDIGGQYFGFNIPRISAPQIPYLAQGAVLPANRPFLAVVGDQKHGTNVEAPLETIQQALANVLAQQGAQDIRITFTGDLAQLARVLKPQLDRENRRVGGSLARGVTV